METRFAEVTSGSVRERLEGALTRLSERFGVRTVQGIRIRLPLRQRELGQYIAASRESTNSALNEMRRQRLIDFDSQEIRVCGPKHLAKGIEAA